MIFIKELLPQKLKMPRIRTIKPKFWDDIKLSKISRDARLLFIGMWNFSDDLAVIVAEPVWIKSKVFPYDKLEAQEFEKWIAELIEQKFIIPLNFNDERFYYIRTFKKHQRLEKPNYTDIYIENEELSRLLKEFHINPVSIEESSLSSHVSIGVGREGKGKGKGEGIVNGREGKDFPETVKWSAVYYKTFGQIKKSFPELSELGFLKWKKFVELILEKNYTEIFNCKFIMPQDFETIDFPEAKWDETIKSILATGIKQEHNLFYRIPQFLKYTEKNSNNNYNGTVVNGQKNKLGNKSGGFSILTDALKKDG